MIGRLWIAVAVFGAVVGTSEAEAQYVAPQPGGQPQLPAEAPELKAPPSPIITVRARASLGPCKKIGPVRAVAPVAGQTGLPAYELVLVEMKEKTLDAGGTHLLLLDTSSGTVDAKGSGEAYRCEPGRGPLPVLPKH